MVADFNFHIDLSDLKFDDGQKTSWLHAMPIGKVQHPIYGEMDFGESSLTAYANSVMMHALGSVDPVIDYDHQEYSGIAAGWVKGAKVQTGGAAGDGLQLFVEWTDEAVKRIKAKEYRYFSPTFRTEWTDQDGKTHKNVLFGGGLTNRPYLKNLVPVNLSDLSFKDNPMPPAQEAQVDLKKLAELLGLAADTPEADIYKAFGERLQTAPPPPPPNPTPPPVPPAPAFTMPEDIKKLAETNPTVKALIGAFETNVRNAAEMSTKLRDNQITAKLNDLDKSNLVVTPATKDLIHDVAVALNDDQADKFWQLMDHFMTSQAFVVEMGERARSGSQYSRDKSAKQLFEERTNALVASGMNYADAVSRVASEDTQLYDRYRDETFIFKG